MRKILTTLSTFSYGALSIWATTAVAADSQLALSGRVGPAIGTYEGDVAIRLENVDSFSVDGDKEFAYGLHTGISASHGQLFADLALEYMRVDYNDNSADRTDVMLSLGHRLGSHASLFAGYRFSTQGDGLFDDEFFKERGPFVGAGLGGVAAGPLLLGASLAFNLSEVQDFPDEGRDFDYDGFSLKLSASLIQMPQHTMQVRFQKFEGDDSIATDAGRLDFELEESYMQLIYLYSFAI